LSTGILPGASNAGAVIVETASRIIAYGSKRYSSFKHALLLKPTSGRGQKSYTSEIIGLYILAKAS
jgi:hypothetical protein